jgi:hypothetical protein
MFTDSTILNRVVCAFGNKALIGESPLTDSPISATSLTVLVGSTEQC